MNRPSAPKHDALTGPHAKARRLRLARQVQDERRSARAVEREGVLENQVEDDLVVARVHVRSDMGSGGLETLSDLDISTDDAEKVKGGRASDPCEGGEITR